MSTIKVHRHQDLYVSEPDPSMFGNGKNEPNNKSWTNRNWLKSRFHFSFAEHSYRNKDQFGVLRVMNDDLVQPSRGFGAHPHRDMEIITYIVRGKLTHQDSMGSKETLGPGSVQFMTAGTGVRHSEHNHESDSDLRFIQSWIIPRQRGLKPYYGSFANPSNNVLGKNEWQHVASDVENKSAKTPVKVNQDVNMYVTHLDSGKSATLPIAGDRMAYVLCIEGGAGITGTASAKITEFDSAEIKGPIDAVFTAEKAGTHILVFEMQKV